MALIECPECGGTWFLTELLFQLSDDIFGDDGEPEMADHRYINRCVPCGAVLDLSLYGQDSVKSFVRPSAKP